MGEYTHTTSKLAREADVTQQTVTLYANLGLLNHIRSSSGARLFRPEEALRVRQIYLERMASRGGRRPRTEAA
jgi:DNA-binding transcriptional MerR regulator